MHRREFVRSGLQALVAMQAGGLSLGARAQPSPQGAGEAAGDLTLFLAGDVMLGRGLDQALPLSVDPELHETYVKTARDYVALAEKAHGPLRLPLDFAYPWGDALGEFERVRPAVRWINLETAVTTRGEPDWRKGIHYRMHPGNVPCLTAAGIDGVSLANNHALDWGGAGLEDTLRSLQEAGIACAGAGPDAASAAAPVTFETPAGRVVFFAACTGYSGVPRAWAAAPDAAGVNRIGLAGRSVRELADAVAATRQPGDRVVLSLHWGGNWGYAIDEDQRQFAHRVIDEAGIGLLHGHSSHHPRGIEIYRGKAILYGCGDFLNDYEGIRGQHGAFRGELTFMYFPALAGDGTVAALELVPLRVRRFRLQYASDAEADWLVTTLDRESRKLGARAERTGDHQIQVYAV